MQARDHLAASGVFERGNSLTQNTCRRSTQSAFCGVLEALCDEFIVSAAHVVEFMREAASVGEIDTHRQRIHVRFAYERLDDDGTVIDRQHKSYTLCYIFCNEMRHLFELCGYEVEALYGGFAQEPFIDSSTEMVWVARKKQD